MKYRLTGVRKAKEPGCTALVWEDTVCAQGGWYWRVTDHRGYSRRSTVPAATEEEAVNAMEAARR